MTKIYSIGQGEVRKAAAIFCDIGHLEDIKQQYENDIKYK